MADHQKIHPANVDTSPSAPLAPGDSLRWTAASENHPEVKQPHHPAPSARPTPAPVVFRQKRKRSRCCRCLCWMLCILLVLIVLVAATAGILYLVYRPRLPKYSVDSLTITNFQVNTDLSVAAQFDVTVRARNPNRRIGIYYEDGSRIGVWYADTQLCNGSLPKFYQGHRNTTVLVVGLAGQAQVGETVVAALQEQQQTGRIPLVLRASVPVRVKFGAVKLRKVRFRVRCNLVVDSLSVNSPVRIRTSSCRFRLKI